ncbi:MAG TPA: hypothetical protein VFO50_05070, partial [Candidatus Limnocylindrales bacterium]|nr:hypothetical protein [Candidatus Limnocylindrales bacterium]
RQLSALRGWARSSPILGVAFGVVLLGAVGLPGMAAFEARGALTELALPAPFDVFVLLAAFAPVVYLGRILVAGLDRMSEPVRSARSTRPSLRGLRPGGWTSVPVAATARAVPAAVRENRFAIAAVTAVLAAAVGLAVATVGLGPGGPVQPLGDEPGGTGSSLGINGP